MFDSNEVIGKWIAGMIDQGIADRDDTLHHFEGTAIGDAIVEALPEYDEPNDEALAMWTPLAIAQRASEGWHGKRCTVCDVEVRDAIVGDRGTIAKSQGSRSWCYPCAAAERAAEIEAERAARSVFAGWQVIERTDHRGGGGSVTVGPIPADQVAAVRADLVAHFPRRNATTSYREVSGGLAVTVIYTRL